MTVMPAGLNDRARGWLRHLHEKATTPDDWSSTGQPAEWWDQDSTAPMCAFPRFDLNEAAYTLPLLADATPAWRELYSEIARRLCERHMSFWAAIDWLTFVGPDPNVDHYPPEWMVFMPERLRGRYPPPGWVGNGHELWGLNPDPLAADGNLFYRGFFNLLLSTYAYVSRDYRYTRPFEMTGYMDRSFTWTHGEFAEFISAQLAARPEGPHCENTKIWPFCISGAGLGLQLYDRVHDTRLQDPYRAWADYAQRHYQGRDRKGNLDWYALYYDPAQREACTFPDHLTAYASICVTPYVVPQVPEWGAWLYEESVRKLGWSDPGSKLNQFLPDPRFLSIALVIAGELGDTTTQERLRSFAEDNFEPRFFGDENTRFGWFFGWDEPYPRGQQNALLMLPELGGQGAWSRIFNAPLDRRDREPTLTGVDYPSLGISRAVNDPASGELRIGSYAATPSQAGRRTHVTVMQLPDTARVRVHLDGRTHPGWTITGPDTIEIELTIGEHEIVIATRAEAGPATRTVAGSRAQPAGGPGPARPVQPAPSGGPPTAAARPSIATIAAVTSCRCC